MEVPFKGDPLFEHLLDEDPEFLKKLKVDTKVSYRVCRKALMDIIQGKVMDKVVVRRKVEGLVLTSIEEVPVPRAVVVQACAKLKELTLDKMLSDKKTTRSGKMSDYRKGSDGDLESILARIEAQKVAKKGKGVVPGEMTQ